MRLQGKDASNSWETFRVLFLRKLTFIVTLHLAVKEQSHYLQYPLQYWGSFTPYMCPWFALELYTTRGHCSGPEEDEEESRVSMTAITTVSLKEDGTMYILRKRTLKCTMAMQNSFHCGKNGHKFSIHAYSAISGHHLSFLLCLVGVPSYRHLKLPVTLFTTSLWVTLPFSWRTLHRERASTVAGKASWKTTDSDSVLNFSPVIHGSSELRVEAACCKCQSALKWAKSTWYWVASPKHAAWNDSVRRRALNVSGCTTIRTFTGGT